MVKVLHPDRGPGRSSRTAVCVVVAVAAQVVVVVEQVVEVAPEYVCITGTSRLFRLWPRLQVHYPHR